MDLTPGQRIKIQHASQPKNKNLNIYIKKKKKPNIKQKQYCNIFNKDLKMVHIKKKKIFKKNKK